MSLKETRQLAQPRVQVNGRTIKIVGGSLKKSIPGETAVRAVSAGNQSVSIVAGLDVSTLVSMVSFDVANTAEQHEFVEDMRSKSNNGEPVTIRIIEDTKQFSYQEMYLTSAPEAEFASEGNISLEFKGSYVP